MCDKNQALTILGEVYHACNAAFDRKIADAYLYGSYARGDFHDESDVDILLTVDVEPEELPAYRKAAFIVSGELSLKHDVLVSVTVKPLRQFRQYENVLPYYQNVIKEGIRYAS